MPPRLAKFIGWVRKPSSRLVRIPLAIVLIVGGIFSFLPVLGLWMLPLGLILIAQDLPFLQGPMARMLGWVERKWMERKAAKRACATQISNGGVTQMPVRHEKSTRGGN
ncbi:hypothetical protein V4R08_00225 [Nitrobacter sp. NHB1]|uniref:hypothetical protein n=1 Tax=Nitrobacter sp. NHB1 TaxID=3119830 RepID=UPI002FFE5DC6